MRFMTPFGVGHFSAPDDSLSATRRPVYILTGKIRYLAAGHYAALSFARRRSLCGCIH